MTILRQQALVISICAIGAILLLHAIITFGCGSGKAGIGDFLFSGLMFLGLPLLPALLSLTSRNPLPAVGACALLLPWMALSINTECFPSHGGGASMGYIAVLFWGTPSSIAGALLSSPIMRVMKIEVKA